MHDDVLLLAHSSSKHVNAKHRLDIIYIEKKK